MIVVDASALVVALVDDSSAGEAARLALENEKLAAPELVDLEVAAALRRRWAAGDVSESRARVALIDQTRLPILRAAHGLLLRRCWELRQNITPYDAAYVALAEALGAPLLTADARLARAPGPRCTFQILKV